MSQPDQGPNIVEAIYLTTAVTPEQYPPDGLPEVAFAGRSNVGKSSLLNTLTDRKRLAKVSREPGRTRAINFFEVDGRVRFVDLPGYGYAKVPRGMKASWGPMVETYLATRPSLAAIALLVDIRRAPEEWERAVVQLALERGLYLLLVATKADQVPPGQRLPRIQSIADRLLLRTSWIVPFSRLTREGRGELWRRIDGACQRFQEAQAARQQATPAPPDQP